MTLWYDSQVEEITLNVEIRFIIDGREISLDSFAQTIVREVRAPVRECVRRRACLTPASAKD